MNLSEHARSRLKQRGISRIHVRRCLVDGTLVRIDSNGRNTRRLKAGNRFLEVAYLPIMGGYLIITAYWRESDEGKHR